MEVDVEDGVLMLDLRSVMVCVATVRLEMALESC